MACGYSFFVSFFHLFRKSWGTSWTIKFCKIARYHICALFQILFDFEFLQCFPHKTCDFLRRKVYAKWEKFLPSSNILFLTWNRFPQKASAHFWRGMKVWGNSLPTKTSTVTVMVKEMAIRTSLNMRRLMLTSVSLTLGDKMSSNPHDVLYLFALPFSHAVFFYVILFDFKKHFNAIKGDDQNMYGPKIRKMVWPNNQTNTKNFGQFFGVFINDF